MPQHKTSNGRYKTWPVAKEDAAHMKMRQVQNKVQSKNNKAELWMADRLKASGYKWTRQAQWGYRVFDFWNSVLGVAIEVDGWSHNEQQDWDAFRDDECFRFSDVLVLRVRNFNEEDAKQALRVIERMPDWKTRRIRSALNPMPNPSHRQVQKVVQEVTATRERQRQASRLEVREVSCPFCLVKPNEPCMGRRGPRDSNHLERVHAYAASRRKASA